VLLRRLLRNQRHDSRLEARQASLHQAQRHEMPDRLRKRHADHDDTEPARRAQDHRLTPIAVRQSPPYRREDREADEITAKDNARPPRNLPYALHTELCDVERQDWRHLAHPYRHHKRSNTADVKIPPPYL